MRNFQPFNSKTAQVVRRNKPLEAGCMQGPQQRSESRKAGSLRDFNGKSSQKNLDLEVCDFEALSPKAVGDFGVSSTLPLPLQKLMNLKKSPMTGNTHILM